MISPVMGMARSKKANGTTDVVVARAAENVNNSGEGRPPVSECMPE